MKFRYIFLTHLLFMSMPFMFAMERSSAKSNIMLNKSAYSDKKLVYLDCYENMEEYARVRNYDAAAHLVTDGNLSTCWESFEAGESVTLDLQVVSDIKDLFIHWGRNQATAFSVYTIDESGKESLLMNHSCGSESVTQLSINKQTRYIKIVPLRTTDPKNLCSIAEIEATGSCSFAPVAPEISAPKEPGRLYLTGGNWKIQRAANVTDNGESLSKVGYDAAGWLPATVPGTVLSSYINAGAVPDNYYSDNQKQLSEEFFQSEFWYRNEFTVPFEYSSFPRLVFTGINYRIKVFVNGQYLGSSDGVFKRSEFNLNNVLVSDRKNALAVLVEPVDNPGLRSVQTLFSCGKNSGSHSADSPAFISSLGWDWIPSVPDRNIGLWNHVYLESSGVVSLKDPYVVSRLNLPDTTRAELSVNVCLSNRSDVNQNVVLKCSFEGREFKKSVGEIAPFSKKNIKLSASDVKELFLDNPKLWWPNGYGGQYLYEMKLSSEVNGVQTDVENVKFGIREINTIVENGVQKTFVNGCRIFLSGGNIGGLDINRKLDPERIDAMIRLHKEMNFTAVRNWVGQTGHKEFYDACDKYGILIFDDFWLSSEKTNRLPSDFNNFMANVRDKILQVRNHPSVMFYCGRNESNPPAYINDSIAASVRELDPYRFYAPSSADNGLSGRGPYNVQTPEWYFENRGMSKPHFHTEMGAISIPVYESICKMLPEDKRWPINDLWGHHDFTYGGAQNAREYIKYMEYAFGNRESLRSFVDAAQFINYNTYRAMFESFVANPEANGLLLWMSQSAWPSFVWQTFDYYLEPSAAFFGSKKALEPVHILWDSFRNRVAVSNRSIKSLSDMMAYIDVYDHNGTRVNSLASEVSLKSGEVSYINMPVEMRNKKGLHYIKLRLEKDKELMSDNFYWYEKDGNYRQMNDIPQISLKNVSVKKIKGGNKYVVTIKNDSSVVLPMVHVKVIDRDTKQNILPIYYSDNFFALLPGETKNITFEYEAELVKKNSPIVTIEGWNIIAEEFDKL